MQFNGKILQKLRYEKGITQQALCQDLHLEQPVYSRYERGAIKNPPATKIKQFAEYFDVPYKTFFAETADEPINTRSNIPERIDVHVHIKIDWGF
jgi:transcriptional regulator with XRE-family HTH domain